ILSVGSPFECARTTSVPFGARQGRHPGVSSRGDWVLWIAVILAAVTPPIRAGEPRIDAGAHEGPGGRSEAAARFDRTIAPLLSRRCLGCHNAKEKKGGLDLSYAESARVGGKRGAVLVPGKPEESLLWERVEAEEMPPKTPLTGA